jgi:hypothetical protein
MSQSSRLRLACIKPYRHWFVAQTLMLMLCLLVVAFPVHAASFEYQNHRSLTAALRKIQAEHPDRVRLTEEGLTLGKREVWAVELGTGSAADRKRRPALLLVAGIEGHDLVSTVVAVAWVQGLLDRYATDDSVRALLDRITIYVFPRVNPDGAEAYFERPRLERVTNLKPEDEDRDGLVDEDGPEDLNEDGLITSMRVLDVDGEYIVDPAEPRLLIKADRAKGERGMWKLLTEGFDNDRDERWNEDEIGGVHLNRNFPYQYQFFGVHTGPHQVSEPETRALAEFVIAHPNIAAAFNFGSADNLLQTPKGEPQGKRPPTAIADPDVPFYRELGQAYRDALGLKKELSGSSEPGTFSDWMYYHRGRLSLAARSWSPNLELEIAKARKEAASKDAPKKPDAKPDEAAAKAEPEDKNEPSKAAGKEKEPKAPREDKRGEEERAALKWFDENAPEAFLPWKEFDHPDFQDKKVEIGGWAPFARHNPPAKLLEQVCQIHGRFLTELAGRLPRLAIRSMAAKHLGSGVHELTVQVENTGYLPTALTQGSITREVLRTRAVLNLDTKQILAGQKTTMLDTIPGSGGMKEIRYIIHARGPVELEVISQLGGTVRGTVELKEAL